MATQIGELKYSVGFDVKKQDLNTLKKQLQQIKQLSLSDLMKINQSDRDSAVRALSEIKDQAENVERALREAFNVKLNSINVESFNKSLNSTGSSLQKVYNTFQKGGAAGENAFRSLVTQVTTTNTQLKQTHKFLDNIATTLGNTIKWNLASTAVNTLSNSVQQAWGYVKSLDTSLNDIRIVTGKSADQMANFAVQANDAAKALGKTTVDYTKAALIYAQQGLSDDEVAARAAITLKTANVTGQSADAVSEQLTSVWNGYKVNAEQAELYVDRLAAVAATTASDLQELSTGMSKVASAAAAMGVGEDQLAAQLSTIISVTRQAPESVGTALRTIYARISDIKAGIDEDGVDLGRYSGKMAELGFNVLDVNGKLRDMGQVIEDIGGRWQTLTREQQVSLAQTMAGQRQYSNLIALFDNFQEYNKALNTAQNAAGTLQKQQDIYMDSTKAHLNQLKAATEDLYDSFVDTDSIKPLIDGLTTVISLAAKFVDTLGGGGTVLLSLGGIAANVFSNQLTKGIQTFIHNLTLSKTRMDDLQNRVQFLRDTANYEGMSDSNKGLFNKYANTLQSVAPTANDEQLGQLFQRMKSFTGVLNEYNTAVHEAADQNEHFLQLQKQTDGQFENIIQFIEADADKQNEIYEQLIKNQEKQEEVNNNISDSIGATNIKLQEQYEIQKALQQQKATKNLTAQEEIILNQKLQQSQERVNNLLDSQIKQLQKFRDVDFAGEGFENSKKQIDDLIELFNKLKNDGLNSADFAPKIQEIQKLLESIPGKSKEEIEQIFKKINKLKVELKSTEAALKDSGQNFDKFLKNFADQKKWQSIGKIAGSFISLTTTINQAAQAGTHFANGDWSKGIGNIATSFVSLIPQVQRLTAELQAMGIAANLSAGVIGLVIAAIVALVAAGAGLIKFKQEELKLTIELNKERIKQQNERQEQIQNNKKLYSSIQDLNKKYKQGQINRIELRSAVEDLIDQYGVEGIKIRQLAGDYDALTAAIKRKKEEAAEEGKRSAQQQLQAAQELLVSQGRSGIGRKDIDGNYNLYFGGGLVSDGGFLSLGGLIQEQSDVKIGKYLENAGFTAGGYSGFEINTDFSYQSILDLYEKVSQIVEKIRNDSTITDADKSSSDLYQNMLKWLNQMKDAVDQYKQALSDAERYSNDLTILTNTDDLNNIKTVNDYLDQRSKIISVLQEKNAKYTKQQAATVADAYLRENYRDLFIQFDQGSSYIQKVRQKLKSTNSDVEKLISDLDPEHLGLLIDIIKLDNIDNWDELEQKIRNISQIDLSNVESLAGSKEAATDRYTFFQSLEDQIRSGKSISSKEIERIGTQAPQLLQMFDMMANGQYKMVEDAKTFYATVESLKLSGFHDAIAEINNQIERTEALLANQGNINYNILEKQNYSTSDFKERGEATLDSEGNIVLAQRNRNSIQKYVEVNNEVVEQQIKFLKTAREKDKEFNIKLDEWTQTLYNGNASAENRQQAALNISDAVTQELEAGVRSLEELEQEKRQTYQAMYDALFPTDVDIEESALAQLSETLQDLATESAELAPSLAENARAANEIAQAVLRFDNAIQDVVDHYDDWLLALSQENLALGDQAVLLPQLRDVYADMLDIDGSLLSNEFLLSTQNLELMKAAIDGDIQAYDNLAEAARVAAIQALKLDPSIDMTHFEEDIAYLKSYLNNRQKNFPTLEIGAELNDQKFLAKLENMLNTMGVSAKQASDILRENLGIDAEIVEEKVKTEDTTREVGFNANFEPVKASFSAPVIDKRGQVHSVPGEYVAQSLTYSSQTEAVTVPKESSAFTLKVTSAHKSAGGKFKYTHASRGAGSAGVKRRTEAAEKAAKAAKAAKAEKTSQPKLSTKQTTKQAKDDRDIYHDINIEIQDIGRELSRVQKQGSKLAGTDLIKNLNKQLQILTKQKVKLQQKNELQKLDLQRQKQQLSLLGATFDEYGHISNYLDIMGNKIGVINGYIEAENALVAQFNAATTKQAQDAIGERITEIQRQRKKAEDAKKDLESAIKDYDGMMNKIEDLADQVSDIAQQKIQIQISKFKMKVELTLDMRSLQQDYNEFLRSVVNSDDLFRTTSGEKLYKDAQKIYDDYQSYYDVAGENSIATLTQQIAEAKKMYEETGNSEWLDVIKSYVSELESSMENMKKLEQDIQQIYFDTMQDIDSQADRQIEQYEYLEEQLQHDIDLVKLIYGQHQYDAMQSYYNQLRVNHQKELSFLRSYADQLWQNREQAILDGQTEVAEEYLKLWEETNSKLNAELKESIEDAKNQYLNAIDKIYYELELKLSNNKGFDYLSMEWELVNKNADQYLDTVNAVYAVQELERKFIKAIDETDNVKAQQALTELMNQQLGYLKSKDKLTQYDVDRAEKLLQIQQARMQLEDSRNAKTSLRLKRDSQGNYSYVYTASEDQVNDAQEKLAKLQNELYNFDKDAYQKNLEDTLSATKEYLEKRKELQIQYNYADEEQKARLAEQLKLLDDNYYQYLEDKATENSVIRKNLQSSVAQECENLYTNNQQLFEAMTHGNYTNFEEMSDSIKAKLIDDLVPGYQGGIQEMIDTFYGTGDGDLSSFRGACLEAWSQVDEATSDYGQAVTSLAEIARTDLDSIKKGVDDVANAYRDLIPENETVLQAFLNQQKEIDKLLGDLESLKNKNKEVWDAAVTEIEEATKALQDYAKEALAALDIPSPSDNNYSGTPNLPAAPTPVTPATTYTPSTSTGGDVSSSASQGTSNNNKQEEEKKDPWAIKDNQISPAAGVAGNIFYGGDWAAYYQSGGRSREYLEQVFEQLLGKNKKGAKAFYDQVMQELGRIRLADPGPRYAEYYKTHFDPLVMSYKYGRYHYGTSGFDTGGYTGAWGTEGRLAFLHQKELVLNAQDTKNMLDSVSIIRNMVANLGGNISSKLRSLSGGYILPVQPKPTDELQQSVSIQANFPNVNSKREIEEAFSELVNMAAQRAMRRI